MITREEVKDPKQRILMACVKMFIEKGFKQTTMLDIIHEADVSAGTFQNIFHTKDGVLYELVRFMFDNQFQIARIASKENNNLLVYTLETAIQLAIIEQNENLREIYIEAYTQPTILEYINLKTSSEIEKTFSIYNKDWTSADFYEAEIGSSGIMRSFMVHRCDKYFTLKKKIARFLEMVFDVYHVPKDIQANLINHINSMDVVSSANLVMQQLFSKLEMTFDFKFTK